MGLQTKSLALVGIGVDGTAPGDPDQPKLDPGIHLRWAFPREGGFPWHGFYLYRRKHGGEKSQCLHDGLAQIAPGTYGLELGTSRGLISSDRPIIVTDEIAPAGTGEIALAKRTWLRVDLSPAPAHHVTIRLAFRADASIEIRALAGTSEVAKGALSGRKGEILETTFDRDAIEAVELGEGPALLVDVCFVPTAQELERRKTWEPVPTFPAPLQVPVFAPAYPLTAGSAENLEQARALARGRIRYGDPDTFTRAPVVVHAAGQVAVSNGSPIIVGTGTAWQSDHVGTLLRVQGDPTAYTVAVVISFDRLVLDRRYAGASRTTTYQLLDDPFGQLHDDLARLVAGGPAAGAMVGRSFPEPIALAGSISSSHGSRVLSGTGTTWGPALPGLALRIGLVMSGTVSATRGSRYLVGSSTAFSSAHAGLAIQLTGDPRSYSVRRVYGSSLLLLDRPFEGGDTTAAYTLTEREAYRIDQVVSPTELRLDRDYTGPSGAGRPYFVQATLRGGADPAAMPRRNPIDLVLLSALHPAVAQMLGLYFIDQPPEPSSLYDYLIVADRDGVASHDAVKMLAHVEDTQFADVDAYIAYGLRIGDSPSLKAPADARAYSLPVVGLGTEDLPLDAAGSAGIRWDLKLGPDGKLLPDAPVLYHVFRAELGDGTSPANPPPLTEYKRVTKDPVLVAQPRTLPATVPSSDWPPFPLWWTDRGLREGWYGYSITAIDLFGRYSPRSDPASWAGWAPPSVIHASAVQILDKVGPPPPAAIEAWALDPADTTVLRDPAYLAWRASLPLPDRDTLVGLRICWRWTAKQLLQAPDLREFRIYLQPGAPGSLPVRILQATAAGDHETYVDLDAPPASAGSYLGAALHIDGVSFRVLDSSSGPYLRVRVRNVGPDRRTIPPSSGDAQLLIPRTYHEGSVRPTHGSTTVRGHGTGWTSALQGRSLVIEGDPRRYIVAAVTSDSLLEIDHPFGGPTGDRRRYAIAHPLHIDLARASSWATRYHVLAENAAWQPSPEGGRRYEVFLPAPPSGFTPTVADPVVRLAVGVSAADSRPHAIDDPIWNGTPWGDRTGNEGAVAGPATVFCVHRTPPPAPQVVPGPDRLQASRADYHGRSYFNYAWTAQPSLRTHVLRALDDSLFMVDRSLRPRGHLDPVAHPELFPPHLATRKFEIAAELDALDVRFDYRSLSDAALCVLAGLPGNERAFVQRTIDPIAASSYQDVLNGRASNRYFYRAAMVDGAHNRGPLSLSSPPVYLPKVVPPRTPSVSKALAGDRRIILRWVSNREPDLVAYRVFASDEPEKALDVRRMILVHSETVPAGNPAARPGEVEWVHEPVPAHVTRHYRLTAVDDAGNESLPTAVISARAFDEARPQPPDWLTPAPPSGGVVALAWTASDPGLRCLVQRRFPDENEWENRSGWLARGVYAFDDRGRITNQPYVYRLRVLDTAGRNNSTFHELSV